MVLIAICFPELLYFCAIHSEDNAKWIAVC